MIEVPNWEKSDRELIEQAFRLGELKLAEQARFAIAADQRAYVVAGIFFAASAAIIAAVLSSNNDFPPQAVVSVFVSCALFMVGGMFCVFSAIPKNFWVVGANPSAWYNAISNNCSIKKAMGQQASYYDESIVENNVILSSNGRRFRIGVFLGMLSPLLGLCIFIFGN